MKTFLVIGLGNPGAEYHRTRHNIGERVLKAWFESLQETARGRKDWREDTAIRAEMAEVSLNADVKIIGMFPRTFMNVSGESVQAYLSSNAPEIDQMYIIHDELEVPFGQIKIKETGSAQGHNGVRSIHQALNSLDIPRIQIGIGRPTDETPINQFVLQAFTAEEEQLLTERIIPEACRVLSEYITPRQLPE